MTPQSLQRGLGWATGAAGGGGIGIGVGALDAMGPAMGGAGMAGGKADFSSVLAAVFLASALSSYVTGQTLHVNGGMAMI